MNNIRANSLTSSLPAPLLSKPWSFSKTSNVEKVRYTIIDAFQQITDTIFPGKSVSHGFAKELLAGFVGGEVDKLAETKGMDEYDKIEARRHAKANVENMYDQHYGDMDQYDPNQRQQPNFNY